MDFDVCASWGWVDKPSILSDKKRLRLVLRHLSFDESGAACHTWPFKRIMRAMDSHEKRSVYAYALLDGLSKTQ